MPTPEHYLAFVGLMEAEDRARWLAAYPFDVAPPTDDRPFFGHFFRWRQVPEVLAMAGHVWQPFGGAGYLVPLALLGIAVVAAGALILLPLAGRWNGIYPVQDGMNPGLRGRINPALQDRAGEWNGIYPVQDGMNPGLRGRINPALQTGLRYDWPPSVFWGWALCWWKSPCCSASSCFWDIRPTRWRGCWGRCCSFLDWGVCFRRASLRAGCWRGWWGWSFSTVWGCPLLSGPLLGLPFWARAAITGLGLAPLGVAMGMPFPRLLGALQEREPALVPWAWGVNGALSVVASVLAALMALSWGFRAVLLAGAVAYLGARLTSAWAWGSPASGAAEPPPR
jgi:hypothetical protein